MINCYGKIKKGYKTKILLDQNHRVKMLKESDSKPKSNISQDKTNECLIDEDDMILEEMQIYVTKLSNYDERNIALEYFKDYLENDLMIPPEIFVTVHDFVLSLIQTELDEKTLCLCLDIIEQIAEYINDELNFSQIIERLCCFLPLQNAFNAISRIAQYHLSAAKFIVEILPKLLMYFNSNDDDQQEGALIILLSVLEHKSLIPDLINWVNIVFDIILSETFIICIQILTRFAETEIGYEQILQYTHLSVIFDKYKNQDEFIYWIIKFINTMISKTKNPLKFLESSNTTELIIQSVNNENKQIKKIMCELLYTLSCTEIGVNFLYNSNLLEKLFDWLNYPSFTISSKALKILCSICSNSSSEILLTFYQKGFIDILNDYITSSNSDLLLEILKAIQTIINELKNQGLEEYLENIKENNELIDSLWEIYETNHNNQIGIISSYIYYILTEDN